MIRFIRALKVILYFATAILPVIDAIKGIKSGIKLGLEDGAKEREAIAEKEEQEKRRRIALGEE